MRIIDIDEYGPASNLKLHIRDRSLHPEKAQVAVQIKAASYNPVDTALREGSFDPVSARSFPQSQGLDWAGVIQATGPDVAGYQVGDEVIGCQPAAKLNVQGSWAEALLSEAKYIAPKPAGAGWEESAALPLVGLTALQALRDHGGLKTGMEVFVNGASGGVGHLAVQLAKILGAQSVVGTASPKNLDLVRELGADEAADYNEVDPSRYEGRFHIYFDAAAKLSFSEVKSMLTEDGVYIRTRPTVKSVAETAVTKAAGLVGYRKQAKVIWMTPNGEDLAFLSNLVANGSLKVVVAETFAFEDYVSFVEAAEKGEKPGKYVLRVGD